MCVPRRAGRPSPVGGLDNTEMATRSHWVAVPMTHQALHPVNHRDQVRVGYSSGAADAPGSGDLFAPGIFRTLQQSRFRIRSGGQPLGRSV
jgi:hypothetical protein